MLPNMLKRVPTLLYALLQGRKFGSLVRTRETKKKEKRNTEEEEKEERRLCSRFRTGQKIRAKFHHVLRVCQVSKDSDLFFCVFVVITLIRRTTIITTIIVIIIE